MTTVRVGLLGCGNVGAALVELLAGHGSAIETRTGLHLELVRVAVADPSKPRPPGLDASLLTSDPRAVVDDPSIEIVVELIGGLDPARDLVLDALRSGKSVVTANKELVANFGIDLHAAAGESGAEILYEASVGGGIPLVRPLRESLAGERITRVMGIVNGTTNYILTKMTEDGTSYGVALEEAQSLGYAERDPTADVDGYDAAAKGAILATIAFGQAVVADDVHREGIRSITAADIARARRLGFVVKLLVVAERDLEDRISVRAHPALVPVTHPLASVRDAFNAVFIEGDAVGELMLYGRGAGGRPTASAVLGDLVDAAHGRAAGDGRVAMAALPPARLIPIGELMSAYYLSIEVLDRPGVLAQVAGVFGEHGVSIRSMEQHGLGDEAQLIFHTHDVREADMQTTIEKLEQLPAVDRVGTLLRVVGDADL
ncbi:MAG TPA: homoserine dehydrogenase [Acidimicrobiales bacterium]|nr:homoserine dehydrogenase [Acidimicrobiales bacterium]